MFDLIPCNIYLTFFLITFLIFYKFGLATSNSKLKFTVDYSNLYVPCLDLANLEFTFLQKLMTWKLLSPIH